MPKEHAASSKISTKEERASVESQSLGDILGHRPDVRLEIENDLGYHLARNVIELRKYRGSTQASLAKEVGTSQAKIARIEGAGENVTVSTIERLVGALGGRLRFSIEPKEFQLPHVHPWWVLVGEGGWSNSHPLSCQKIVRHTEVGGGVQIFVHWVDSSVSVQKHVERTFVLGVAEEEAVDTPAAGSYVLPAVRVSNVY